MLRWPVDLMGGRTANCGRNSLHEYVLLLSKLLSVFLHLREVLQTDV